MTWIPLSLSQWITIEDLKMLSLKFSLYCDRVMYKHLNVYFSFMAVTIGIFDLDFNDWDKVYICQNTYVWKEIKLAIRQIEFMVKGGGIKMNMYEHFRDGIP